MSRVDSGTAYWDAREMSQGAQEVWVYDEVINDELQECVHAKCGKAQGMKGAFGEDGMVEDESLHGRRDGHCKERVAKSHFPNFSEVES